MNKKKAVKDAFNELAPRYEAVLDYELRTFWGRSYQEYVNLLVDQSEISENQKILDIATGTAMIPRNISMRKIPGIHITGLDITESMLLQGKRAITNTRNQNNICLTCGDAMELPFAEECFDVIITGLASHHMDISRMLNEIKRTIKKNGKVSMIDAGVPPIWHFPVISSLFKIFVFFFFLIKENKTRAIAEADAVTNVFTAGEWQNALSDLGFKEIQIEEIPGKYKWIPDALSIKAISS